MIMQKIKFDDEIGEVIKEIPTAYDVDKVIDRLKEELESTNIQLKLAKDFEPKESVSVKK